MANEQPSTSAGEIRREECFWGHILCGTKEALIAACLARPEWFPRAEERDSRGRRVRTKRISSYGRCITCRQIRGHFELSIERSPQEQERYELEQRRRRDEAEESRIRERESALEEARIRAVLAPPVTPGSLSEGELAHVRLLRTLSPMGRRLVFFVAEQVFEQDLVGGDAPRQPDRKLKLIVDNETVTRVDV